MLQDLIGIAQSTEFLRSEGRVYIDAVTWHDSVSLTLSLTVWCSEQESKWRLSCDHVLAHRLQDHRCSTIGVTEDHPVLWPHAKPCEDLYVSSRPTNPAAVFGELGEVEMRLVGDWFPLSRFLNRAVPAIQILSQGNGLLTTAPQPIVRGFCAVLHQHGIRHHILPCPHGRIMFNSDVAPKALLLNDSYVVALHIAAESLR